MARRKISILIVAVCLITLLGGCKQTKEDSVFQTGAPTQPQAPLELPQEVPKEEATNDSTPPPVEEEKQEPELNEEEGNWIEVKIPPSSRSVVTEFDPANYRGAPYYSGREGMGCFAPEDPPKTTDGIMADIGENGLILSGQAVGNRISYKNKNGKYRSLMQFKVDHVFYGDMQAGETITIADVPILFLDENDKPFYISPDHQRILQNGEYVLLLLSSEKEDNGAYKLAYPYLTIGKDCADWSEESLTQLLDYYRGDPSTYKELGEYTEIQEAYDENGNLYYEEEHRDAYVWPKKDLSNEAMIEELKDNLLIRLASEYKIKIWPELHINYKGSNDRFLKIHLSRWDG